MQERSMQACVRASAVPTDYRLMFSGLTTGTLMSATLIEKLGEHAHKLS